MYYSTKTYGHERGLSCCFRQYKADSHCALLHGYALAFEFVFGAEKLDDRNWVMDFGGLDSLKAQLEGMFDHTLVVAKDDPEFETLVRLGELDLADVRVVDRTGCESFAELAFNMAKDILEERKLTKRVKVISVKVSEHGANSAIYKESA